MNGPNSGSKYRFDRTCGKTDNPSMNGSCILSASITLMIAISVVPVMADRIVLKNGRTMDGVIDSENADRIVLNLGVGSMTIKRPQIARVERSTEQESDSIRKDWADQYFLHEKYVPESMSGIGKGIRDLVDRKAAASRARTDTAAAKTDLGRLEQESIALRKLLTEATVKMQKESPDKNVPSYNAAVNEINSVRARQILNVEAMEKARATMSAANASLLGYADAVAAFEEEFRKSETAGRANGTREEQDFIARVGEKLATLSKDVETAAIPVKAMGGSTIVSARVNGRVAGNFIVDTGASMMTVTDGFMGRLGTDVPVLRSIRVTLADGTERPADVILLRSVMVGTVELNDVEAVVLPGASGDQTDGLLGMTFLGHFNFHVDSGQGRLTLRRIKP